MKLLLHTCCGPCTIVPLQGLRAEGAEVMGYYLNPNIHPFTEWDRRRSGLDQLAAQESLRLLPAPAYAPGEWLRGVAFREGERCRVCHHLRLRGAALTARRGKFDAFSSTLLYSRYQKHDLIREIGEAVGSEVGIRFLYRDWRHRWSEGVDRSRALGLYRQSYCGCLLSEAERYAPRRGDTP